MEYVPFSSDCVALVMLIHVAFLAKPRLRRQYDKLTLSDVQTYKHFNREAPLVKGITCCSVVYVMLRGPKS